jgi:hypothetical protein
MTPQAFLAFWQAQSTKTGPSEDRAGQLYHAYRDLQAESDQLRQKSISFLLPGKDARGRWIAVFSESHVDEVASLAQKISDIEDGLKSISNDIIRFMELAGGPELRFLLDAVGVEYRRIKAAEQHVNAMVMVAASKAAGSDIREDAGVKKAYDTLAATKREVEPKIKVLVERRDKAEEIIKKHARPGAPKAEEDNPPEY